LRLPRDLSGHELAKLLRRYGYEIVRQSGSHLQLRTSLRGTNHQVTVPAHKILKLGTLNSVLSRVADYTKFDRSRIAQELFDQ
jgi:predicted RNA binding protein YcfA (HicA-like mRNA interferase family)